MKRSPMIDRSRPLVVRQSDGDDADSSTPSAPNCGSATASASDEICRASRTPLLIPGPSAFTAAPLAIPSQLKLNWVIPTVWTVIPPSLNDRFGQEPER